MYALRSLSNDYGGKISKWNGRGQGNYKGQLAYPDVSLDVFDSNKLTAASLAFHHIDWIVVKPGPENSVRQVLGFLIVRRTPATWRWIRIVLGRFRHNLFWQELEHMLEVFFRLNYFGQLDVFGPSNWLFQGQRRLGRCCRVAAETAHQTLQFKLKVEWTILNNLSTRPTYISTENSGDRVHSSTLAQENNS